MQGICVQAGQQVLTTVSRDVGGKVGKQSKFCRKMNLNGLSLGMREKLVTVILQIVVENNDTNNLDKKDLTIPREGPAFLNKVVKEPDENTKMVMIISSLLPAPLGSFITIGQVVCSLNQHILLEDEHWTIEIIVVELSSLDKFKL
jgi:hypothetical protein